MRPNKVLIHNPLPYGGFKCFDHKHNDDIQKDILFRSKPDPELFSEQYNAFVSTLENTGLEVISLSEILGHDMVMKFVEEFSINPNFVYTRDALITLPWEPEGYIRGSMQKLIRQTEPIVMEIAAKNLGLRPIIKVPEHLFLEGGDVIPFEFNGKRMLLMGFGRRTTLDTIFYLKDTLIQDGIVDEIIGFSLASWRINLDGGCVPISNNLVIMHESSLLSAYRFTKTDQTQIEPKSFFEEMGYQILAAEQHETIFKQACNIFCCGEKKIICYNMSQTTLAQLGETDLNIYPIDGSELVIGTGGPRCMTRPIYTHG